MYAVLEDALLCFQEKFAGSPHEQRCRAQEAARWFFSDDQHSPYSFVSICAGLSLDAEEIRNKLKYLEQDIRVNRYPAKKRSIARNNHSESRGDYAPLAIIERIGRSHYDSRQS
jgi:hypothetical protein